MTDSRGLSEDMGLFQPEESVDETQGGKWQGRSAHANSSSVCSCREDVSDLEESGNESAMAESVTE